MIRSWRWSASGQRESLRASERRVAPQFWKAKVVANHGRNGNGFIAWRGARLICLGDFIGGYFLRRRGMCRACGNGQLGNCHRSARLIVRVLFGGGEQVRFCVAGDHRSSRASDRDHVHK